MSTSTTILPPQILVEKIKKLQEKYPSLDLREILRLVFMKQDFAFVPLGNVLELEEDAYIPSKAQLGQPTRLSKMFETLKEYTKARTSPEAQIIGQEAFHIEPPENVSMSIPFSVMNTESGAIVQGEVVEGLLDNTIQMTPVSSSTVMASGMFHNELLVQFLPSGNTPQRTYRYPFGSPEEAKEAHESLLGSGSPGRWVWQNLRGHSKGEPTGIKIVPEKYGPALSPPSKTGKMVIGGTSASLVPYSISNRTPVGRVQGFTQMSKVLQRSTSNPALIPPIEKADKQLQGQLQSRGALRNLGIKGFRTGGGVLGLPKLDFTLNYVGNVLDFTNEELKKNIEYWYKIHCLGHCENCNSSKECNAMQEKYPIAKELKPEFEVLTPITRKELRNLAKLAYEDKRHWQGQGGLSKNQAKGWFGESERHSRARKEGKADFILKSIGNVLDLTKDDALSDCTSRGYSKEDCFKFFNAAQTKATEKAKEPYRKKTINIESKETMFKNYDISTLKRKLNEGERDKLSYVDKAVENFPKRVFDQVHPKILIVDRIPDHPDWKDKKGQIPEYYQQVGLTKTFDEVPGAYHIERNECIISLKNSNHIYETTHHELAHAIWNWGQIPLHLKQRLGQDLEIAKMHQIDPYYKSLSELHSLLWETHRSNLYFKEDYLVYEFMKRSGVIESDAKTILKSFDLIREWANQ